ncbi:MAG: general secretion pathway protein GspK [Gammaproteobacteria bacterium]|nr:general secretion pathway protein GspK [Gammaproteobacteria bacterium]
MSAPRHARRAPGVALISALLIAAVIAGVAVILAKRQQFASANASQLSVALRAEHLVMELEIQAMSVLQEDLQHGPIDSANDAWAHADLRAEGGGLSAEGRLLDLQGRFNLTTLAFDPAALAALAASPEASEDGSAEGGLAAAALRGVAAAAGVELGGAAPAGPAGRPRALSPQQVATVRFVLLLQALEIDPVMVPAVLDWLDPDSEVRFPNGAEDAYYGALPVAYRAANHRLVDPGELLAVRGVTPAIDAKLRPFVTVLDQAIPLNINTAPTEIFMSLTPGIERTQAERLLDARAAQPFTMAGSLATSPLLLGLPFAVSGLATASSTFELQVRVRGEGPPKLFRSLIRRNGNTDIQLLGRQQIYVED